MSSGVLVVFGDKKPAKDDPGKDMGTDQSRADQTAPASDSGRSDQPAGDASRTDDPATTMERETTYRQAVNDRRRKRLARVMGRDAGRS